MKPPRKWNMIRPGFLIPVFFLSCYPGSGQVPWQESSVSAVGGCFASRTGLTDGRYNQAGLGWIEHHSLSVQHARPFILCDLGISSLSIQVPAKTGGFGATLSSFGITGLRQTSTWISYGLKLHPDLSAGLGLHFWNSSIREHSLYHFGASCALGIRFRINQNLFLGAHVMHPVSWPDREPDTVYRLMMISTGFSYTFFKSTTYHSDLHILPEGTLQWCHGLEHHLSESIKILLGMHNRPYSVSGGITVRHNRWSITIAFAYRIDTGTTPSSSLSYAW